MPLECLNNIKLKRVNSIDELCKVCEVDEQGKVHREVKIFVYDNDIRSLVMIDKLYVEEEKVSSTRLSKWYDINEELTMFIEDVEN